MLHRNFMFLLIDLDGTLTDTAHEKFKPYKDGLQETDLTDIPLIKGAKEFIIEVQSNGHIPIIISDSHPRYVNKIADRIFQIPSLSLADKPNSMKTLAYLKSTLNGAATCENSIVIGDTWLDIELGRALNFLTVLTTFYNASIQENRDGIGQDWKHIKSGPTFYAKKFEEVHYILNNPPQSLLSIEAIFHGIYSSNSVKFKTVRTPERFVAYRTLARQNAGECDKYAVADRYFEFHRADRSQGVLKNLSDAISYYINHIQDSMPSATWDYFTYVSDKATTQPPNKLADLFEMVETDIPKTKLIQWVEQIEGSIRNQKDYRSRRDFVDKHIYIDESTNLSGKNIVILDDQFTTGGTAYSICGKLIDKGAKNVLFITMFYLVSTVESERACPKCGTKLQVKINRSKGTRFLSCVSPRYGGKGCGEFLENIL